MTGFLGSSKRVVHLFLLQLMLPVVVSVCIPLFSNLSQLFGPIGVAESTSRVGYSLHLLTGKSFYNRQRSRAPAVGNLGFMSEIAKHKLSFGDAFLDTRIRFVV